MANQNVLKSEDSHLLGTLAYDKRVAAVAILNGLLDGQSVVLEATVPPMDDVASAVLAAANLIPPAYQPGDEDEGGKGFAAYDEYHQRHLQIVHALMNASSTYARSAEALLAHLVRVVGGARVEQ